MAEYTYTVGSGGDFANIALALNYIQSQPTQEEYILDIISNISYASGGAYYNPGNAGSKIRITCSHNAALKNDQSQWYTITCTDDYSAILLSPYSYSALCVVEYLKFLNCYSYCVYFGKATSEGSKISNCVFILTASSVSSAVHLGTNGANFATIENCLSFDGSIINVNVGGTLYDPPTPRRKMYNCVVCAKDSSSILIPPLSNVLNVVIKNVFAFSYNSGSVSFQLNSATVNIDYCATDGSPISGGTGNVSGIDYTSELISIDHTDSDFLKPKSGGTLISLGYDPSAVITTDFAGESYVFPFPIGSYQFIFQSTNTNIIGAIKITLDQRYAERADIGLYTPEQGNSEIRWSEAQLFGVTDTYNYEMLLREGIGEIASSIDDSIGGNNETINDFIVSVKGTNQFILRLEELGIQLSGKPIEHIEFEGTDDDSDSVATTTMFTGAIEDYSYNEFECPITAKSSFVGKRNKCLGQRASSTNYPDISDEMKDETVPVTFGRSDPENGRFFKLPRIEFRNDLITNTELLGNYDEPKYMSSFPVAGLNLAPLTANKVRFLLTDDGTENGFNAKNAYAIVGKYIHITDADVTQEECEGVIRKISARLIDAVFDSPPYTRIALCVQLKEYLPEVILGYNVDQPGDTFKAFLSVIDALTEYILDSEECECFISGTDFYVKEDDEMVRVVDVGIVQDDADVPVYEVASDVYDGEIGNTNSFKILPVESLEPYLSKTGEFSVLWAMGGGELGYEHPHDGEGDDVAGVFVQNGSGTLCANQGTVTGAGNYKDKDYTTQYLFTTHLTLDEVVDHFDYSIALKVTLPEIDDTIQFDKVYLGLRLTSSTIDDSTDPVLTLASKFRVMYKSYYDKIVIPIEKTSMNYEDIVEFDSLPDDYYSNSPATDNKEFYYAEETGTRLTGYKTFDLNIADAITYKNIDEFIILLNRHAEQIGIASYIDDSVAVFELAIIFEKNITIGTELYA